MNRALETLTAIALTTAPISKGANAQEYDPPQTIPGATVYIDGVPAEYENAVKAPDFVLRKTIENIQNACGKVSDDEVNGIAADKHTVRGGSKWSERPSHRPVSAHVETEILPLSHRAAACAQSVVDAVNIELKASLRNCKVRMFPPFPDERFQNLRADCTYGRTTSRGR